MCLDNEALNRICSFVSYKEDKRKFTNNYSQYFDLFPFQTRSDRADLTNGFERISGEFARLVSGSVLESCEDVELLCKMISDKIVKKEGLEASLESFVTRFLFAKSGKLNVFSPSVFKRMPLSAVTSKSRVGEKAIAKLLFQMFGVESLDSSCFQSSRRMNFFEKFIDGEMRVLPSGQSSSLNPIQCPLNYVKTLFLKDFKALRENEKDFCENYPLLLGYYYFFYCSQLTLKICGENSADLDNVSEVFYFFDDEKTSSTRKGFTEGYNLLSDCGKGLLMKVSALSQFNALFNRRI